MQIIQLKHNIAWCNSLVFSMTLSLDVDYMYSSSSSIFFYIRLMEMGMTLEAKVEIVQRTVYLPLRLTVHSYLLS